MTQNYGKRFQKNLHSYPTTAIKTNAYREAQDQTIPPPSSLFTKKTAKNNNKKYLKQRNIKPK